MIKLVIKAEIKGNLWSRERKNIRLIDSSMFMKLIFFLIMVKGDFLSMAYCHNLFLLIFKSAASCLPCAVKNKGKFRDILKQSTSQQPAHEPYLLPYFKKYVGCNVSVTKSRMIIFTLIQVQIVPAAAVLIQPCFPPLLGPGAALLPAASSHLLC